MLVLNAQKHIGSGKATFLKLTQRMDSHIYALVKLDGKLISRPHFKSTPVADESRVAPLTMIAGG